jgi:hypothetical protein
MPPARAAAGAREEILPPATPVAIWPTKTRPMVGYHRAGSRMEQNTTLGSRAPDPDFITGLGRSKMGNLPYWTKTPPDGIKGRGQSGVGAFA